MTDSTITRLGSKSFTPPKPIKLGEPRKRVRRDLPSVESFAPPVPVEEIFGQATRPAHEVIEDTPPVDKPVWEQQDAHDQAEFEAISAQAQAQAEISPKPELKFSMRKRIAFLLAIVAIPAAAASGNFGEEPGAAPAETDWMAGIGGPDAMPFEQAGMSFPGSAFYYIDASDESLVALPSSDPLASGGEFGRDIGALIDPGPAASAFFVAGSMSSQARAQECLSQAVYYEAGTEGEAAQRAVAQVILNRVAHPKWPGSVCGVAYEKSARGSVCEFGFACDGSLARKPAGSGWTRAQDVARDALAGKVYAPIGLATHYHTRWDTPHWAANLSPIGTVGAHRFYRALGAEGEKSAFTGTYSGIEPRVGGRIPPAPASTPRRAGGVPSRTIPRVGPSRPSSRPSRAAVTGNASPGTPPTPAPAAVPAPPPLPRSGDVKSPYANAGQWKKKPGAPSPTARSSEAPKE